MTYTETGVTIVRKLNLILVKGTSWDDSVFCGEVLTKLVDRIAISSNLHKDIVSRVIDNLELAALHYFCNCGSQAEAYMTSVISLLECACYELN
jgi:hypothetical protein